MTQWAMCYISSDCLIAPSSYVGAPCGFSGRFEDGSFGMKTKMKIFSNLHWRMKMWRAQISGLLKNEDYQLPHSLKMKIAFLKLLKSEDLKTPLKNVKKMKTMVCREPLCLAVSLRYKAHQWINLHIYSYKYFIPHIKVYLSMPYQSFASMSILKMSLRWKRSWFQELL